MLVLANCQRARSTFTVGRSLRGRGRVPVRCGQAGHGGLVVHPLLPPQAGVAAAGRQQLGVGAALDDPAAVEHDDLVHGLESGQAVGDEERGSTLGQGEEVRR